MKPSAAHLGGFFAAYLCWTPADDFDGCLLCQNLIYKSVPNVDPPGICAVKISQELLIGGWLNSVISNVKQDFFE